MPNTFQPANEGCKHKQVIGYDNIYIYIHVAFSGAHELPFHLREALNNYCRLADPHLYFSI